MVRYWQGVGVSSKELELHNIYGNNSYIDLTEQLKNACSKLDQKYFSVLLYCTLTGSGPAEACVSFKLLKERKEGYLTKDNKELEHFVFPEVFTKRTKNAHFSVVFEKTSNIAETSKHQSFISIRLALRRQNLKMKISISRKIFANFL